jgi:hypothetical protein
LTGIEQPVEMDDEIAHVGIVHGLLRLRLPGAVGGGLVGKYPDDLHLIEILERGVIETGEFASDNEVKQLLLGTLRHNSFS